MSGEPDFSQYARLPEPRKRLTLVKNLVTHAVDVMMPAMESRGIIVETILADSPLQANIDSAMLHQVLQNLLLNARQAMPDGGKIKISIRSLQEKRSDNALELVIADTGSGIPANIREGFYEPFISCKPDGLGIGIPLAKKIMELHGGSIQLENNEEGPGAKITLRLPIA